MNGQLHKGYLWVELRINGKRKRIGVHQVIMLTFRGPCPKGKEVCHWKKPCRTDNRLSNLRYGTRKQNLKDAKRHGTIPRGENRPNAVLTWKSVRLMRRLWKSGKFLQKDLAELFGVSKPKVSMILNNKIWRV